MKKQNLSDTIAQELTEKFVKLVAEGKNPWKRSWEKMGGFARNAKTGHIYNGINQMILGLGCEYESPFYLTYKQAQEAGGNVKKGEKSQKVVFWKILKAVDKVTGEEKKIPMLKVYFVFNIAQCENLEKLELPEIKRYENSTLENVEQVIENMPLKPRISIQEGFARCCYVPSIDLVKMPKISQFQDSESYYHVLFHELAHSTGHKTRLNRKEITGEGVVLSAFGSQEYAKEELVAEMASSFVTSALGLWSEEAEKMTVSYLQSWLKTLQENPKELINASSKALKACQWILGEQVA